jgi:hypothetical protein
VNDCDKGCAARLVATGRRAALPLGAGEDGVARRRMTLGTLPLRIGPVEIDRLGGLFALRCPEDRKTWTR